MRAAAGLIGCPARIRTSVKGSKVLCATTTPPGNPMRLRANRCGAARPNPPFRGNHIKYSASASLKPVLKTGGRFYGPRVRWARTGWDVGEIAYIAYGRAFGKLQPVNPRVRERPPLPQPMARPSHLTLTAQSLILTPSSSSASSLAPSSVGCPSSGIRYPSYIHASPIGGGGTADPRR